MATRNYTRRPPIVNNRDADKAKTETKPYQRKVPAAPGTVLRVQPTGTKVWKLLYEGKTRTLGKLPVMTYSMAVEKALAILRGEDPDARPEAAEPPPLTFQGYIDEYYERYARQHHGRPNETISCLTAFNFGDKALTEITLADAEAYRLDRKAEGKAASTINRQMATLKAALQRAFDWDLLENNPLVKLKPLKIDKRSVVRFLSEKENKWLLEALVTRDLNKQKGRTSGNQWREKRGYDTLPGLGAYSDNLTPMITLALNTGLRRGELWNLAWGDIDFKRAMLTVHGKGAKSGQTRHIPLNAAGLSTLKIHKGKTSPLPSVPVFGRHDFKKAFSGVLKNAEIENFRFHDLRHTFASRLVMAGVPLNTVRELMGHASLDMTLVYAHLAPDNLREAVEMLS